MCQMTTLVSNYVLYDLQQHSLLSVSVAQSPEGMAFPLRGNSA